MIKKGYQPPTTCNPLLHTHKQTTTHMFHFIITMAIVHYNVHIVHCNGQCALLYPLFFSNSLSLYRNGTHTCIFHKVGVFHLKIYLTSLYEKKTKKNWPVFSLSLYIHNLLMDEYTYILSLFILARSFTTGFVPIEKPL